MRFLTHPYFTKIEEKSTKIEAFKGYYVFIAQIASAKILLSQPISAYLFISKIFEFDFFLLIFAACPTPLGGLVMHNWRVVSSYFLNALGNASWGVWGRVVGGVPCEAKSEGGLVAFLQWVGQRNV